jgi:hypothetical protein
LVRKSAAEMKEIFLQAREEKERQENIKYEQFIDDVDKILGYRIDRILKLLENEAKMGKDVLEIEPELLSYDCVNVEQIMGRIEKHRIEVTFLDKSNLIKIFIIKALENLGYICRYTENSVLVTIPQNVY